MSKNLMDMTSAESLLLWKKEQDRLNEALDIAYEALWAAALLHLATQDVLSTTHEQIEKVCTECVKTAETILGIKTTVPFIRKKRKLRIEWKQTERPPFTGRPSCLKGVRNNGTTPSYHTSLRNATRLT